ncbi:hypothetical protein GCM10009804_50570 [Kribbella hippodromi]|uniref:Polyketide cyclase/dehydrase/lipid transport protein n=1 Tax=Kribbella hippodromi TaxID=434347 RepID=A0ABP4PRG2_9ACTN
MSPEVAWDVVMDWERQSRWMLFTRVWATGNGGVGVGGGVAARTSVGGIGFTDDMVITRWEPPRECTVEHLGKIVRGTGTFIIEPAPLTTATNPSTPRADSSNHADADGTPTERTGTANAPTEQAGAEHAGVTRTAPEHAASGVAGAEHAGVARTAPEHAASGQAGADHSGVARTEAGHVGAGQADGEHARRCRVVWREDVVPPLGWVGAVGWWVGRWGFELLMRVSLRRLVREVGR